MTTESIQPIRAAYVDDDPNHLRNFEDRSRQLTPWVNLVGTALTLEAGIGMILRKRPQLLILDVELGGGESCFDLLVRLKEEAPDYGFQIILHTAYPGYAQDGYDANAIDFLEKGCDDARFEYAMQKARDHIAAERWVSKVQVNQGRLQHLYPQRVPSKIGIPTMRGVKYLRVDEVEYCEADGPVTNIYLSDGQTKIKSCKSIMELMRITFYLHRHTFIRIHRSFLINEMYRHEYIKPGGRFRQGTRGRGGQLFLENYSSTPLPVSQTGKIRLEGKLDDWDKLCGKS